MEPVKGSATSGYQRGEDAQKDEAPRNSAPEELATGTEGGHEVTEGPAALARFDRQIPGFAGPEGVLVGLESRSSGPLRLPRDPESFAAEGFTNLYPVGEGAGYAGGIMSAALDGARSAKRFLARGAGAAGSREGGRG